MEKLIELISILVFNIMTSIKSEFFIIIILILFIQYRKIGKVEKQIIGINKKSVLNRVTTSTLLGILGGIIGSLIILGLGITIEKNDFSYVLVVSLILMLFHPRFVCLSYSGGIISLISIITGYPNINVSNLMSVVAVLHLVESILILIDGTKSKIPIFIERKGEVVGGFTMTRYWAVPFTILVTTSRQLAINTMNMPSWWPLLSVDIIGEQITYFMTGIIAILGYGDNAITEFPHEKTRQTAKSLVVFSISLLLLSILANNYEALNIVVALYAPLAHELVIYLSKKKELRGKPVFNSVDYGLRVLDIMPKSIGEKLNIKSGNVVKSINGRRVYDRKDMKYSLLSEPKVIVIEYYDNKNKLIVKKYKRENKEETKLGLLVVNRYNDLAFDIDEDQGLIGKILKKQTRT